MKVRVLSQVVGVITFNLLEVRVEKRVKNNSILRKADFSPYLEKITFNVRSFSLQYIVYLCIITS